MDARSAWRARRWMAIGSLGFVGMNVALLALVFSSGSPPPNLDDPTLVAFLRDHDALFTTATLLSYLSLAPFVAFIAGLRSLIRGAQPDGLLADAVFALGAAFIAIAFVDFGLMGVAQANAVGTGDATTVRVVEEVGRYVGNLPSSLEWAMLIVAASAAFWKTALLPRWVSWVGWTSATVIVATSASLYVGDSNSFFAADGGVSLFGTIPLLVWMTCVAVPALRRGTSPDPAGRGPAQGREDGEAAREVVHTRATPRRAASSAMVVASLLGMSAVVSSCGASTTSATAASDGGTSAPATAPGTSQPEMPGVPVVQVTARERGASYSFSATGDLKAGLVLLDLHNEGQQSHQAGFVKLKPGQTYAALDAIFAGPHPEQALAQVDDYGGANEVAPGTDARVIVDLTPGDYYLMCFLDDGTGAKPHLSHGMIEKVEVGAGSTSAPIPPAVRTAGTITLKDFGVVLPDGFTGKGWYKVENVGDEFHEAAIYTLQDGKTIDEFKTWATAAGKAHFGGPSPGPAPTKPAGGVTAADKGRTQWVYLDLDPAKRNIFVCFMPDPNNGFTAHWTEGMITPWPTQ